MNYTRFLEKNSLGITGYIAVLAYYAVLYFDKKEYMMILMVVFLMCLLAQYVFMFPKYKTEQISNAIMSMLYAGVMLSYLYSVREGNNGAYTVWLIFLCSWGSDTCAYLAGVAFGKHKMAPVLSPKKSVEGGFAIICAVGALISMVGDLAASAIKRNHDIKDYGKLIPGHGGIMDRFDSVIYVAPVIWILLQIF